MSIDGGQNEASSFRRSPTGPRVAAPRPSISRPPLAPLRVSGNRRRIWSVVIFVLLISGFGIRAYRDLSRPDAWAYWKDQYYSPSLTSSLIPNVDLDGARQGRPALLVSGTIGPAAASWFRDRLDEAHLVPGDVVVMSSPGGDLEQAVIMGEVIRAHGLATAVGAVDGAGKIRSSHCASACVFVYAGGVTRFGVPGSQLGVHRFVSNAPDTDAVAETQRTTGQILSYMTKMGVSSSSFVEAMSATGDIRWLDVKDARAMNLITDPVRAQ
jgi:hypothetical protein